MKLHFHYALGDIKIIFPYSGSQLRYFDLNDRQNENTFIIFARRVFHSYSNENTELYFGVLIMLLFCILFLFDYKPNLTFLNIILNVYTVYTHRRLG